jgi:hypothetical protein
LTSSVKHPGIFASRQKKSPQRQKKSRTLPELLKDPKTTLKLAFIRYFTEKDCSPLQPYGCVGMRTDSKGAVSALFSPLARLAL